MAVRSRGGMPAEQREGGRGAGLRGQREMREDERATTAAAIDTTRRVFATRSFALSSRQTLSFSSPSQSSCS